jgi:S-adenosylmethionine synthetase
MEKLRADIIEKVITPIVPKELCKDGMKIFVNPTGRFVIGGPMGDSGLTGRKIIVDTYGGWSRHGGGAFSGKDPTKVDRTAAYAARYLAKNVVKAGLADKCEVQIAYAIGVARPVSVMVETFGTGKVSEEALSRKLCELFDLRPAAIIKNFELRRPIYRATAAYGHMGREELSLPWEKTDLAEKLKEAFK